MKEIPRCLGYYATQDGNIWSSKSNKYLKLILSKKTGYLKFGAYYGSRGTMKNIYVHVAVCSAYRGLAPNSDSEVRHLDGKKLNNCYENLCWGTSKQNHEDQVRHGTDPKGERNAFAKYKNEDIFEMRQLHKDGLSCAAIARKYETSRSVIGRIVNRKSWSHI